MPDDDVKPEEKPAAAAAPALDPEALGRTISEQVAAQVANALANQPGPAAPTVPAGPTDALEEVIAPYVQRGQARTILIAQLAADKADFYTEADPDELAERIAHKDEVEKRTMALAQGGRPWPRLDVYRHLKGEKETEFAETRAKRKAAREKRALEEGGDHGADGVPRTRGGDFPALVTAEAAHDLQGKGKLDEFLGDKSF